MGTAVSTVTFGLQTQRRSPEITATAALESADAPKALLTEKQGLTGNVPEVGAPRL